MRLFITEKYTHDISNSKYITFVIKPITDCNKICTYTWNYAAQKVTYITYPAANTLQITNTFKHVTRRRHSNDLYYVCASQWSCTLVITNSIWAAFGLCPSSYLTIPEHCGPCNNQNHVAPAYTQKWQCASCICSILYLWCWIACTVRRIRRLDERTDEQLTVITKKGN